MAASSRRHQVPDYYALLGISRRSSFREIEQAYWEMAKREENRDKVTRFNEAYEVLGHKDRREAYDAALERYGPIEEKPQAAEPPPRGNPDLANKLRWHLQ